MNIVKTTLDGACIIEPKIFRDPRGYFFESYSKRRYHDVGIRQEFVQDNVSWSSRGVLRGLHFQNPNPQGKLVSCLIGEVFDVIVDIRLNSPTFGKWFGVLLSQDNQKQLWIPPGFAHGFVTLSESALFCYKCTNFYAPESEHTILWDDKSIGINWPENLTIELSKKDLAGKALSEIDSSLFIPYLKH